MNIKLLSHTPEPEKVVASSARLCYSDKEVSELMDNLTENRIRNLIDQLRSTGHESPMEHISFTFSIDGISRSCSHQLVRHRIASVSQRSQRYVKEDQFEYVTPSGISVSPSTSHVYDDHMALVQEIYDSLVFELIDNGLTEKEAIEDARYVLPNACSTSLVLTMNARSLLNFFNLRCCNRSQEEIRRVAEQMLSLVRAKAPTLFKHAGRPCLKGYCPENNMQCKEFKGRIKTLDELLEGGK